MPILYHEPNTSTGKGKAMTQIPFNGTKVLNDGFVALVDHMGDDSAIVQAARISYGKDNRNTAEITAFCKAFPDLITPERVTRSWKDGWLKAEFSEPPSTFFYEGTDDSENIKVFDKELEIIRRELPKADRNLIRYLLAHSHTTPFEMVEFKFIIRVPMDCWRQWIRHRTASVNEYSTRYTEAIDSCQTTPPDQWRLQSTSNKQGSSGFLPASYLEGGPINSLTSEGQHLTSDEMDFHEHATKLYKKRLEAGVAKEQARKDLPLSTYTEAYWKIDLHNLFHFLRLRMDSHAQYEIRQYANAIYDLIKPIVPIACEAFEDYKLQAVTFSRMEMELIRELIHADIILPTDMWKKPDSMTDREWTEFKAKAWNASECT